MSVRVIMSMNTVKTILLELPVWKQVDFYLLNHLLILAKQHIYSCRNKGFPPSLKIFLAKLFSVYQIETVISDSNGKGTFHDAKWKKFIYK